MSSWQIGCRDSCWRPATERRADGDAVTAIRRAYDGTGFGGAPKFPPSMTLEWLLRHHARTGVREALEMVVGTANAMARGGIYDQLGGGFARYSVDADWVVPHFEKMLYDNALLLRVYAHLWRTTGDALAERVVRETATFLLRDLRTAEGGFASALDADTEGVEGATYVWTPTELGTELDSADADWAVELLNVTERGTFEHGASTLQLLADPDDWPRWYAVRDRLRAPRVPSARSPLGDDKVVTAWNGLAIAALAEAGATLRGAVLGRGGQRVRRPSPCAASGRRSAAARLTPGPTRAGMRSPRGLRRPRGGPARPVRRDRRVPLGHRRG